MIRQVQRVGFTVSDLDPVLAFYTQVLPFEIIDDCEMLGEPYEKLTGVFGARVRVVTLGLGQEQIQLTQFIAPSGGRPIPPGSRSNDLWFQHLAIVVSDMDTAYATLREHNVQHVSTAPQTLPDYITAAAGIRAFYFRDPDGHNLELIWFPEGKGAPRWQSRNRLFLLQYPQTDRNKEELGASPPPAVQQGSVYQGKPKTSRDFALGIDHTAIGIANTERSLRFYRDILGLTIAGESENYGTEQEHLNMVFGAHLHITGLKAPEGGMGIEFLNYLSPPGGRPMPADTRPNDLWYWQMTMLVPNAQAAYTQFRAAGVAVISAGIVTLPDGEKAFLVRDPDGHAAKIVELKV
jgi:catechol 2,3-dioxygenase-like lactoylglutathione lyase family enzyme